MADTPTIGSPAAARRGPGALIVLVALFALGIAIPSVAAAEPSTAQIAYPGDGAAGLTGDRPFEFRFFTAPPPDTTLYLQVGTTPGGNDLLDTGEFSSSRISYPMPPLPSARAVYARLWTNEGGHWTFDDASFTTAAVQPARFTYPTDG